MTFHDFKSFSRFDQRFFSKCGCSKKLYFFITKFHDILLRLDETLSKFYEVLSNRYFLNLFLLIF